MAFSRKARALALVLAATAAATLGACKTKNDAKLAPVATAAPTTSSSPAPAHEHLAPATRVGSVIARAPDSSLLFLADEDHKAVRAMPMKLDAQNMGTSFDAKAAPAQVVALDGRVLVTLRDPGFLLVLKPGPDATLTEEARVELPADAWGLAVSKDERTAVVTSAWTHKVTAVDLDTLKVRWTLDVDKEPRGVVIGPDDDRAYVSHLQSADLTRIDGVLGTATAKTVKLPASPVRTPPGKVVPASLGYALTLSPDGKRLFAARHALGAMGQQSWYGSSTVDVLMTADDKPLGPMRSAPEKVTRFPNYPFEDMDKTIGQVPLVGFQEFSQPRAIVPRPTAHSVLVVSEGLDAVVELDARLLDPTLGRIDRYEVGTRYDPKTRVAQACAAPQGLVLSADETEAYVFCRGTYDLARIYLRTKDKPSPDAPAYIQVASDPLGDEASIGRRVFYYGGDNATSGGLGCAGCHPEGREDGHVWHEAPRSADAAPIFTADEHQIGGMATDDNTAMAVGMARQTPMLAGRVAAKGPYGWHAQNPDIVARVLEGFELHRWDPDGSSAAERKLRAVPLAAFLRVGLVPPPRETHELTTEEKHGKELFESDAVGCSGCHDPAHEYTDRKSYPLTQLMTPKGYAEDPNNAFKTPSLMFVAGTAPYFHDGSAPTLEALIDNNGERMGHTAQLAKEDRKALVAFLKTL